MATVTKYHLSIVGMEGGGASGFFLNTDGWNDEIAISLTQAIEAIPFFAGKVTIEKTVTDSSDTVLDMTTNPPSFH